MKKFSEIFLALLVVIFVALNSSKANATLFTLIDENSKVQIHTDSDLGMNNWEVDGKNQIFQQWFWFREGDTNPEAPLNSLPIASEGISDSDFDGYDDTLYVRYDDGMGLEIALKYTLAGGSPGSQASDVGEQVTIRNTSGFTKDLHFFQYSHFHLNDYPYDNLCTRITPNSIQQTDNEDSGVFLNETVLTPEPDHWEIELVSYTYAHLNDGLPSTLFDAISPSGPDDLSFSWQWDFIIPDSETLIISKNKSLIPKNLPEVPEPGSIILLLSGLLGITGIRRRKIF